MNPSLFAHQFRSLLRRRRLAGLLLLVLVPALILLAVGLAGDATGDLVAETIADGGAATFPIAALILAAATLRDERDGGTLPYVFLKPIERTTLAVTSVLAASAATGLLGLAAGATLLGATAVIGGDTSVAAAAVPLYVGAAAGYSALFVPLGYLLPRVVLIGLGYVILWEQVVARLVTGVANTSIWRFALSIYADLIGGDSLAEALGPVAPGLGGGVAKLVLVLALGLALLVWALRRRDAV